MQLKRFFVINYFGMIYVVDSVEEGEKLVQTALDQFGKLGTCCNMFVGFLLFKVFGKQYLYLHAK